MLLSVAREINRPATALKYFFICGSQEGSYSGYRMEKPLEDTRLFENIPQGYAPALFEFGDTE